MTERLRRTVTYRGFTILIGSIGASFVREGKVVASARRAQRLWLLQIPGHQWEITPDMPIARFQKLPGGATLTRTPVKGFPSYQACVIEIERLEATK